MIAAALQAKGWTARTPEGPFLKGDWVLDFDTGNWMIASSKGNPRVFDVPVPVDRYMVAWTVNVIEHLCLMEDERARLRSALAAIGNMPGAGDAAHAAAVALGQCYHRWLVNVEVPDGQADRVFCPVCGRTAAAPEDAEQSFGHGVADNADFHG